MRRLLFTPALLGVVVVLAQKPPQKFGDVSPVELITDTCPFDSSAEAFVEFDYGNAYISTSGDGLQMIYERQTRIKILKKEGLRWADVSIPLYHRGTSKEKVATLKGVTYTLENGKVVETKLSNSSAFDEHSTRNIDFKKFSMPNVREGSVIEYYYRIVSDFFFNFPNWQFQYEIPVGTSEFWAQMPEYFTYRQYMQGYVPVTNYEVKKISQQDYQMVAHHWVTKEVPAFRPEPYMTSEDNYVSKMNFALAYVNIPGYVYNDVMGSWEKLNKDLLESEYFGKIIAGENFLKKDVDDLVAGIDEPAGRVEKIYDYVKTTIEWNEENDYETTTMGLRKVMDDKKGSAGDINLALISMLSKAGIAVDPVVISTRTHGFIRKEFPMSRQFNYVIARVRLEDQDLFLDATEPLLPAGVLPERCLNGEGLVISERNFGWVPIVTSAKSKTSTTAELVLTDLGSLSGRIELVRDGYDAYRFRKNYRRDGEEEYVKELETSASWDVNNRTFAHLDELHHATIETYEVGLEGHATVAGDVLYINPFVNQRTAENPFRLEQREYPVDFGSQQEYSYLFKLTIPEGFVVDEMPASRVFMLPKNAGRFMYNANQSGNTVTISRVFNINKTLFTQNEYPNLREFLSMVVAKEAEQIVLKKAP